MIAHDTMPPMTDPLVSYLVCDACRVTAGPFGSYEEWADAAARLGWAVGEVTVLCALCAPS